MKRQGIAKVIITIHPLGTINNCPTFFHEVLKYFNKNLECEDRGGATVIKRFRCVRIHPLRTLNVCTNFRADPLMDVWKFHQISETFDLLVEDHQCY